MNSDRVTRTVEHKIGYGQCVPIVGASYNMDGTTWRIKKVKAVRETKENFSCDLLLERKVKCAK